MPGSGKSTVGSAVATELGWPFQDLDAEIARQSGHTVAELFASGGEAHFREWERRVTMDLRGARATVVSAGGGWVTVPDTVALVRPPARMAYLKVSPTTALHRLRRTIATRPLLRTNPGGTMESLLEGRAAAYGEADLVVDTELLTPQQVTKKIVALVRNEWAR